MRRFWSELVSAPFQLVLVVSFSLVAAMTFTIGAWVIARTIQDYLAGAMAERVNRDMRLAQALYEGRLRELAGMTDRLALDSLVQQALSSSRSGGDAAPALLDQRIANELAVVLSNGNRFVAILDADGRAVAARLLPTVGGPARSVDGGDWSTLPIVRLALREGRAIASTEVWPAEILAAIGLATQACIDIVETPRASPTLCDPSEGRAGLVLIAVTPVRGANGRSLGATVAFHMFNNDFTLVDQIKGTALIDSATIFHGDLRVSTNVLTPDGKRAIGTRISKEVSDVVLNQGRPYIGLAFVVNENHIARYDPLIDHTGQVIGSLYVGVRESSFTRLVNAFNVRLGLVAVATVIATFLLAIPVSRRVTRPLKELRELAEANRRVAAGDLAVRVPVRAGGDVGQLATSFNAMLDALQSTHDQLVHSEKLASLGQLAAGVAHELNNPLATILLYADILWRECPADDPKRTDLQMIVNETRRCKEIVSSLLDFARQNQVDAQPTDLNALIEALAEVERKRPRAPEVAIVLDLDPALPIIQADPTQIQEVIANLVSNGLDAMPNGGQLTIRTRRGPTNMVTIEVEDTGVGMSEEHLNKLFTPFFTTKAVGKGTGLGLAITYGIIKMHRGQISVRSQVGRGTTFTIHLPITLPLLSLIHI
ncbi:MAG: cache domain-containing protein, partial [Anaerolineae bacterium]|nr:cache domain-containing protein [Anaerolineae bacterium]